MFKLTIEEKLNRGVEYFARYIQYAVEGDTEEFFKKCALETQLKIDSAGGFAGAKVHFDILPLLSEDYSKEYVENFEGIRYTLTTDKGEVTAQLYDKERGLMHIETEIEDDCYIRCIWSYLLMKFRTLKENFTREKITLCAR